MQATARIRELFEQIRKQLFFMIPEKWDRIDLYASVIEIVKDDPVGEMFFYYFPKGLLRKNPVNVYEVPAKFNIEEESYLKLAAKLYGTIKQLYLEWKQYPQEKLWTNLTIRIENARFYVEFDYEPIVSNEKENQKRRIIWLYENLGFPLEKFNREEKAILEEYVAYRRHYPKDVSHYVEGIYENQKNTHNVISYGYEAFEKEENWKLGEQRNQELQQELDELENKPRKRNQILN